MSAIGLDHPILLRFEGTPGLRDGIELACDADHLQTNAVVVDTTASDNLDPFVVAAAIAQATDFIPIVVAVPVPHWRPYPTARRLAELDKISAGRLLWGTVDSNLERTREFISIVSALLTSWRPGALVNERTSGRQADLDRIVPVAMSGRYFSIDSPLDVPPGPQGAVPVVDLVALVEGADQ